MKRRPSPSRLSAHRLGRALALCAVLFGLGIHILYTPFHLVHEDHLGIGVHAHPAEELETSDDSGPAEEDDHVPHPALDHAGDFLVRRSSTDDESSPLVAVPSGGIELPSRTPSERLARSPVEHRPPERPPRASSPRAPPARS